MSGYFRNHCPDVAGLVSGCLRIRRPDNPEYALGDFILEIKDGQALYQAYAFEDYKLKVNRYIEKNRDHLAIHKLRNNIPLTAFDYKSLEHIHTGELGSAEDYQREYQDSFIKLFDGSKQKQIVEPVSRIKENAIKIVG